MANKGLTIPKSDADCCNNRQGIIKGRLFVLQQALDDLKTDVDRSYALNEIGEKTQIISMIENMIDNPYHAVFDMSENFDNFINNIIDRLVRSFLNENKRLIKKLYLAKTISNDLFYAIILEDDTFENRSSILRFYDVFYLLDISKKYPVGMQFVPSHLEHKLAEFKQITL